VKRLGTLNIASRFFPKLKVFNNVPENSRSLPFFGLSADSSDVDRGYRVKAISVPAIPIRVGAQRRWRDSVSREVIEIVKLGELSSERSEAILMWSWEGGVGGGGGGGGPPWRWSAPGGGTSPDGGWRLVDGGR
jgi:hypothetical protein